MDKNKQLSNIVTKLFEEWEKELVLYCHWKSSDHLDASFTAETDLDVLVNRKDALKAVKVALDIGFVEVKSTHFRGYPAVSDYICYDVELGRWVHLHFHTQLELGDRWVKAYHIPFEELILQNRIKLADYNIWNIAPEFELLILIYRMNAKFKKNWLLDKKIQKEINFISSTRNLSQSRIEDNFSNFLTEKAITLFYDLFERKREYSKYSINEYRKEFKATQFRRMSKIRFFFFSKLRYSYRLYSEFNRRLLKNYASGRRTIPRGGVVVAFVGIDGSGKSTGIERTAKFFAKQLNVQCNFLGSGKSGASWPRKLIMNLMGFKAKFKGHKKAKEQAAENLSNIKELKSPPFYYLLWLWLCTRDRERQVKKIKWGLANCKLVFVDRWLQDSVLDGADAPRLSHFINHKGFTGRLARREQKLYREMEYLPLHQVVKLNITPEISTQRKPGELTLESAARAIKNMNDIDWPSSSRICEIDAAQSVDTVTAQIKESIWRTIQEYK